MRQLALSQAIRRGTDLAPQTLKRHYFDLASRASCPLGAAFLGSLHGPGDVQRFFGLVANSSDESICQFILVGLFKAFPWLGLTVRVNDRLSQHLEREHLIPRLPAESQAYRRENHLSIFGAITRLHDDKGWSKDQVAGLLARCEL